MQRPDALQPAFSHLGMTGGRGHFGTPPQKGIPTLITWNFGGNEVSVEGSWDDWKSRYSSYDFANDQEPYDLLSVRMKG